MYDYIVVGAGSAGCVLAARLSEGGAARVLLLEAGGDDDVAAIHEPAAWPDLLGSAVDWQYVADPEPAFGGRRVPWPRGKVVGGTSAINVMQFARGDRRDFDHWNYLGNEGWGYEDVLPYFKSLEDYAGGADAFRGVGGPLAVTPVPAPHARTAAFLAAAAGLGFSPCRDLNGAERGGFGLLQVNVRGGARQSAATAFLRPAAGRANLEVRAGARALRVRFEGRRAVGVEVERAGAVETLRAGRVVLCAGALESPKLLLASGVGPAGQLAEHGIVVVADLPGVGENLQDHVKVPVHFAGAGPAPAAPSSTLAEGFLLVDNAPGLGAMPHALQLVFCAAMLGRFTGVGRADGFTFIVASMRPAGRGSVSLRSADPREPPRVRAAALEARGEGGELALLTRGVRLARALVAAPAFDGLRGRELSPGPAAGDGEGALEGFVRGHAGTFFHPVGTCKMGRDAAAVVGPTLRVHGVEGLWVVDASVMPTIVSAPTQAATMMIAERGAALLRGAP